MLGTARMTRPLMGAAALALTLWGLAPASAHAQLTGSLQEFTGRSPTPMLSQLGTAENAVTAAECAGVSLQVRFTGISNAVGSLIFFQGSNCQANTPARGSSESTCIPLEYSEVTDMQTMRDIAIPLNRLLECDTLPDTGQRTIFVLAIDNENDMVNADQVFSFPLRWNFGAPAAVSDLVVSGGERSVRLTWQGSTAMLRGYEVFVDAAGCMDGTVIGDLATNDPPTSLRVLGTSDITGTAASATVSFPDAVPIGGQVAVGVRAVDEAGNPGDLTARCVTRTEVTTWWDTYCMGPEASEACRSSGCSVRPHPSAPPPLAMLALLGVGTLLVFRRRTR
ncbi:MAG: hypothetical protein SangKO_078540 [Sandaracinaceae bacterium]